MIVPVENVAPLLDERHYLGRTSRGQAWADEYGVIVFAAPTARRVPGDWLEITRWCITSNEPNAGSRQFKALRRWLMDNTTASTLVSYSDPSVGHTGALYRACGWLWAPTWHRLRPPPTGNGTWSKGRQAVKDRWVYPLRRCSERELALTVKDAALIRRMPWASYREPSWRKSRWTGGGGDYQRFKPAREAA